MTGRIGRKFAAALALCALVLGGWALAGAAPARAQGAEPAARISAFYTALLDTMKRAKQLGPRGRYEKLAPVVMSTFDVAGMTRVAAGPGWERATSDQQAAMIDAFWRMMTATYASRFDDFAGENFEVSPAVDQPPAAKLVRTRLILGNGKTVALSYLMRNAAGGWKIADVYLDGTISELAARRAEFSSIIRSGGPDALVSSLRQKVDKLLAGT